MRLALGVALIAAAFGLLRSASAAPGDGQIAFTAGGSFDQADVVLVDARGESLVNLTPGGQNAWDDDRSPSWSPDGRQLAFVSHRDTNRTQEIYVMAADGTGARRLTTDSGDGQIFNVDPAWSPDGTRIAWRKVVDIANDEIAVMNADGSGQRRLTSDGGRKTAPQWSPDSTRLLYSRLSPTGIHVVEVGSGSSRRLTPEGPVDHLPRWSPDGRRIAFTGNDTIWVMNADGSGRRQVTQTRGLGATWSPDGTKLAFSGTRTFPDFGSRYGPGVRVDVFVANVDGTGEQRLTGPLDEGYLGAADGSTPTWWPDGSRLFFLRSAATYVVNADGSCETRFASVAPRLFEPAWRPGFAPGLPSIACADLRVVVEPSTDAVGLKEKVFFQLKVENDGNLRATGVRVRIKVPGRVTVAGAGCTSGTELICVLPDLAPHQRTQVYLHASSPAAQLLKVTGAVSADQPDSDVVNNAVELSATVLPCTRVGTMGHDLLRGTPGRDLICARAGWDRINGLAGADTIDAGNGHDTIDAGMGADTILGKGGMDVILARDGIRDTIDCGTENDLVLADPRDRIAKNCERVVRR